MSTIAAMWRWSTRRPRIPRRRCRATLASSANCSPANKSPRGMRANKLDDLSGDRIVGVDGVEYDRIVIGIVDRDVPRFAAVHGQSAVHFLGHAGNDRQVFLSI